MIDVIVLMGDFVDEDHVRPNSPILQSWEAEFPQTLRIWKLSQSWKFGGSGLDILQALDVFFVVRMPNRGSILEDGSNLRLVQSDEGVIVEGPKCATNNA